MSARPAELPRIGAPLADTHAHLEMLDDPAGALERAAIAGVSLVVTILDLTELPHATAQELDSWLADSWERLRDWEVGAEAPEVLLALGVHPHNAKSFRPEIETRLVEMAADPRVAAIGEIGLDFHYDHSPRDDQRQAFRKQLAAAHRCCLPAIIHLREAHDEGYDILQEIGIPDAGCVLHCFTGDAELAMRFVDIGCHISFAGPVTFKNADAVREAAAVVPLDRILVETDCPFMAPEPYRGQTNEPAWTVFTASRIAQVRGMDLAEFAKAAYDNSRRVFSPES